METDQRLARYNRKSLEVFVAYVDAGCKQEEASKRTGKHQPSVSRTIKSLEEDFVGALFYRDGQAAMPTKMGYKLYEAASMLLRAFNEIDAIRSQCIINKGEKESEETLP